ncbi:MAG: glycosyltransferase [Candidatus Methanomethylicia archaeon]
MSIYGNVRISVVIPCFNSGYSIRECVESLINQTYKPLEIIIIDQGSKDSTKYIELV